MEVAFSNPERLPVETICDFHPWMACYFTVLDHPYCAITDKDGKFRIEKLPAGTHTFTVWHERCGYLIREWKITVNPEQTATMPTETVPAEKFKKR